MKSFGGGYALKQFAVIALAIAITGCENKKTNQSGAAADPTNELDASDKKKKPVVVVDAENPKVSLRAPQADGKEVTAPITESKTISLSAKVTDNVGVVRVEFWAGNFLIGVDTDGTSTGMFSLEWPVSAHYDGSLAVRAEAYDKAGNKGRSKENYSVTTSIIGSRATLNNPVNAINQVLDIEIPYLLGRGGDRNALGLEALAVNAESYVPAILKPDVTIKQRHVLTETLTRMSNLYMALESDPKFTACEKLALLRMMEYHVSKLWDINEFYDKGRTSGNVQLRQASSLHAASMILATRSVDALSCKASIVPACPDCAATGVRVRDLAKEGMRRAFDPSNALFANWRADGHYPEGYGYISFFFDSFPTWMEALRRYDRINIMNVPEIYGVPNPMPNFFKWLASAQRLDGTWEPLNDSSGMGTLRNLEVVMSVLAAPGALTGAPAALQRTLRDMHCRQPPALSQGEADWRSAGSDLAKVLLPKPTRDWQNMACPSPLNASIPTKSVFESGGHVHLRSPANAIAASFYNEGSWYKKPYRSDWDQVLAGNATSDSDMHLPLFFFNFASRPATRPAPPITNRSVPWAADFLRTAPDSVGGNKYWNYQSINHKRFNDSYFTLWAYGHSMIFGPGYSDYGLVDPVEEFRMPRSHSVTEVNGIFPKTAIDAISKARKIGGSGDSALFVEPTDLYDRVFLWAEGRYLIVFDILTGRPLTANVIGRYHGRRLASAPSTSQTLTKNGTSYTYQKTSWDYFEVTRGKKIIKEDTTLKLLAFPGLPSSHVAIEKEENYDACDSITYTTTLAVSATAQDFCRHDALKLRGLKPLNALPILLWPQKTNGTVSQKSEPIVTWDFTEVSGAITAVTVKVEYRNDANALVTHNWKLPLTATPTSWNDIK